MHCAREVEHLMKDGAVEVDAATNTFRLETRRFVAAIDSFVGGATALSAEQP